MSMYTRLLQKALLEHPGTMQERTAAKVVRRRRRELQDAVPPDLGSESVSFVLARELAYDVALVRLATAVGIATDPSNFEHPGSERTRLEQALLELGFSLENGDGAEPAEVGR